MNCQQYDDVLGDYVDGAADGRAGAAGGRLAAFVEHLAGCATCQAAVADFAAIRLAASSLDQYPLPPGIWTTVASRIEQGRAPGFPPGRPAEERLGAARRTGRAWVPPSWTRPAWFPVAAALALVVGGATLAWFPRSAPVPVIEEVAEVDTAEPQGPAAEAHYDETIAGLQQMTEADGAGLDPAVRAVLRQNLAVVDHAISESRAALSSEPASSLAQDSLLDALDSKVALLEDTVALSGEAAGEPSDEAAGAAQERP